MLFSIVLVFLVSVALCYLLDDFIAFEIFGVWGGLVCGFDDRVLSMAMSGGHTDRGKPPDGKSGYKRKPRLVMKPEPEYLFYGKSREAIS